MFSNLFFSTLPLFGLVFIGYSLGKFSLFNDSEAKIFSKLVAIVVVPAFGIKIIGNLNYEFINWKLYFCYLLAQGFIYFIAFIIAKKFFNRSTPECIIIGLVSSSSNHLFFIYPIVLVEFAAKDIVPIETVIAADFITVGLSVCALDFTTQNKLDVKKEGEVVGQGTGDLKSHLDVLKENNVKLYVSGMSAKARGYDDSLLDGFNAEFAMPDKLLELSADSNTVLCY